MRTMPLIPRRHWPIMAQEQAFLADILANPDDDAPRLIFADWLDDNGQADRAAFLRAQVELAGPVWGEPPLERGAFRLSRCDLPARGKRTRRRELERQIRALWKQHGKQWAGRAQGGSQRLEYWERGFCAHHYARDVAALLAELPRRLKKAPIQHARVGATRRQELPQLVGGPLLSRMRSLELFAAGDNDFKMVDADVALLADCPHLTRLEQLELTQHRLGPEGLRLLAHATNLPCLRGLYLYGNKLNDECVNILAASPLAARLRAVHLSGITAAGARVLAATSALAGLLKLNLDNANLGDAGARYLGSSRHLSGLTELWLHNCEIGTAGVMALARSPNLANVEVLDLSSNWSVAHAAAVALAESPYLKHIRYLDVWRCEGMSRADKQLLRKRFRSRVNFGRTS